MTFYLKPPRGSMNLHQLEECAKQRLNFYNNIGTQIIDISNFDCLVEDSAFDRTGHFILRLMAYSSSTFKHRFLVKEQKLLDLRLNCYDELDIKYFLRRLAKHCKDCFKDNVGHALKEFYIMLLNVCAQMLKKWYLKHVFCQHSTTVKCEQFTLNVPFYYCSSLIHNREVDLKNGFAIIDCSQWKILLLSLFDTYLKMVLEEMKYNQSVENTLEDNRIKNVLKSVKEASLKKFVQARSDRKFNISDIHKESKLFPLCMLNLYKILEKTNRLSHNERYDFSLYMKGIGLSMTDSLSFWETKYSKEHSTCSRCTHSWQKNEKRYIYGIRHLYGLEGSRKHYQPRSCNYLQEKTLGPNEYGGCPFKHFDDYHLRKVLKKLLPGQGDNDVDAMVHERTKDPNVSCTLFYEIIFKLGTSKQVDQKVTFENPVNYYLSMKEQTQNQRMDSSS